eukprot:3724526-Amphidinium_carterae.1
MPRQSLSAEEELRELHKRSKEINGRIVGRKLKFALKHHPERLVASLWDHALSIMTEEELLTVDKSRQEKLSKQAQSQLKRQQSMKEKADEKRKAVQDITDPWSTKGGKEHLADLTIPLLRKEILGAIAPIGLSEANLKSHEKLLPRLELLHLVEYCTGLTGDFSLRGKYSSRQAFRSYALALHKARSDRGNSVRLPPSWQSCGVYKLLEVEDNDKGEKCVVCSETHTGVLRHIPAKHFPEFNRFHELYIDYNWSETRACVKSECDSSDRHVIAHFFGLGVVDVDSLQSSSQSSGESVKKRAKKDIQKEERAKEQAPILEDPLQEEKKLKFDPNAKDSSDEGDDSEDELGMKPKRP